MVLGRDLDVKKAQLLRDLEEMGAVSVACPDAKQKGMVEAMQSHTG